MISLDLQQPPYPRRRWSLIAMCAFGFFRSSSFGLRWTDHPEEINSGQRTDHARSSTCPHPDDRPVCRKNIQTLKSRARDQIMGRASGSPCGNCRRVCCISTARMAPAMERVSDDTIFSDVGIIFRIETMPCRHTANLSPPPKPRLQ